VRPEYRDGLLALAGLVSLSALAAWTVGAETLLDPVGAAAGVAGAVVIEGIFLRYSEQALGLWNRRGVPVLGLSIVLVVGVVALSVAPLLLVATVWGLLSYLVLLGFVLAGLQNPVSVLFAE
jgi:hypothetical protein